METRRMLTDEEYVAWLADGWIELTPTSLNAADHQHLYDRAGELYDLAGKARSRTAHLDILGDNLRAQVPELDDLLGDPVIDGALVSLLGPDYLVHPHSYCHKSGPTDQVFHQDGNLPWNERGHERVHRPDWAMLFYYPQDVNESNGPTEIVPGSQYWTVDHEIGTDEWHRDDRLVRGERDSFAVSGDDFAKRDRLQQQILDAGFGISDLPRRFVHVRAGTVVLAHYDLVHRGSRAVVPEPRYMYKFYFARTQNPAQSSPEQSSPEQSSPGQSSPENYQSSAHPRLGESTASDGAGPMPDLERVRPALRPMVEQVWTWSRRSAAAGERHGDELAHDEPLDSDDIMSLSRALTAGRVDEQLVAAYQLGALVAGHVTGGEHADRSAPLAVLSDALLTGNESARRAASHGLRTAGPLGVGVLRDAMDAPAPGVRRVAAAGLGGLVGDLARERTNEITTCLAAALAGDADDLVRSNAAYSLGQVARSPHADPERIGRALLDRLAPGAEPVNATSWELDRSTVRQSAAFALVQLLANHELSGLLLDTLIDGPLRDQDRYVQGLTVDALSRAKSLTPAQTRRMLGVLNARRWNPSPRRDMESEPAWTPSR